MVQYVMTSIDTGWERELCKEGYILREVCEGIERVSCYTCIYIWVIKLLAVVGLKMVSSSLANALMPLCDLSRHIQQCVGLHKSWCAIICGMAND